MMLVGQKGRGRVSVMEYVVEVEVDISALLGWGGGLATWCETTRGFNVIIKLWL